MKIALLGKGKTGGKILNMVSADEVVIFDTQNPMTAQALKKCDVAISFLPGHVFLEAVPMLLEANIPVVTGSTGFDWPQGIEKKLIDQKLIWVRSNNFSLGMNIVREMITILKKGRDLFNKFSINIHEIHHTKKLDAPSGTAKSWDEWIGGADTITHERIGDVVGYHKLSFQTPSESIELTHEAHDRAIFAEGALFAAKLILQNNKNIKPGLIEFNHLVRQELGL